MEESMAIFFSDGFVEFFAKYANMRRAFDAKAHLPAFDLNENNSDIFAQTSGFFFACSSTVQGGDWDATGPLNLKTAVEREQAVQTIDVHRECTNCVVTFLVMNQLVTFTRGCEDFGDPTAVFRLKDNKKYDVSSSLNL